MSYDRHDTATKLTLPNQTVFLTVPQGATVHIDDIILHHLSPDRHDIEIEIMDAFVGHNFTIDDTLERQLLAEGTKLVKFNLKPTGLTATFSSYAGRQLHQNHPISIAALGLLLTGWIVTAIIAHAMYKYIQKLQARLDSLLLVSPRFMNQSANTPLANPNPPRGGERAY